MTANTTVGRVVACIIPCMLAGKPTARNAAARRRHREALILKACARDALCANAECGAIVGGISEQNWPAYAARWPALREGIRIVRVSGPTSRGRARWLKSAVLKHIAEELLRPDLDGADEDDT